MKNLQVNNEKFNSLKGLALALALVTPMMLTGCSKKADCAVTVPHAHLYTNEAGYDRYVPKENLRFEGYDRQEEYISIEGYEDLYKFLTKKDLLRIDDNLDLIKQIQEQQVDYTEYRYKYTYMQPIPHTMKVGKTTTTYFTYIPQTRYSWTSDPNHSRLTGDTRLCHYVYVGYKVEKNEKGKYVLVESPAVDDLTTIMDEYPYFKTKFYYVVTSDGKAADYEDGKQEDMSEEEKQRADEYEEENPEVTVEPQAYHQEEKGKTFVKSYT